jgi:hypothetical protein
MYGRSTVLVGTVIVAGLATTIAGCSNDSSSSLPTVASTVSVSVILPASGPTSGGTRVTINGTGFGSGAAVTFGGIFATNIVIVNGATIAVDTPIHAIGAVDVVVTNTNGQRGTSVGAYTYGAADLQGNWSGRTGQGAAISFVVNLDNAVTRTSAVLILQSGSCATNITSSFLPVPILKNSFSAGAVPFFNVSGTFDETGVTASGAMSATINNVPDVPPCFGSITTSWTATKR